jgi:hypothetical protein
VALHPPAPVRRETLSSNCCVRTPLQTPCARTPVSLANSARRTRGPAFHFAPRKESTTELLPLSSSGRLVVSGDERAAHAGDPQVRRAVAVDDAGFGIPTNAGTVIKRGETPEMDELRASTAYVGGLLHL